ncbi:MAG: hypothetical protein U5L98_18225 [Halomonas sp.]|uniref:hypothetical protein n=1 Tax=Halomonas sp. TaxID=1486246 RepID=UPI002ACDD4D3|nr:hypothetical protein [Halomonas sp.]MDZ7854512.1 hypothetical protein [Halomonas sp.]
MRVIGHRLLEGGDLLGSQVDFIQPLKDRPPESFGVPLLTALFLADLVQRLGEGLPMRNLSTVNSALGRFSATPLKKA